MKTLFPYYWTAIIFAALFTVPSHWCTAQIEPTTRMAFTTRHQGTGATRNYETDSITVELDGSNLTLTAFIPSGRPDPEFQVLVLIFPNFTGRGFYQFPDDNAIWQNLNTGDGLCHSLSGSAEVIAYQIGIMLQGSFRFLCESTPRTGDPFNTIVEGEFLKGFEGAIFSPAAANVVPPDTTWTVRWYLPGRDKIDMYYTLEPDPNKADAQKHLIARNLDADDEQFKWEVPDTMSPSGYIIIVDSLDLDNPIISDEFRLRAPRLARLITDPDGPCPECPYYEEFVPNKHGWKEINGDDSLFSPVGMTRMGYSPDYKSSNDPITGEPYDPIFTKPPVSATKELVPEWPHWTDAFLFASNYVITSDQTKPPQVSEPAVRFWRFNATPYQGSCAGMAVSAAMAFADPEAFFANYPEIGSLENARNLFRVGAGDVQISDLIGTLFCYQFGVSSHQNFIEYGSTATPMNVILGLQAVLLDDNWEDDGYLNIASEGEDGGGHAVLPYRLEIDDKEKTAKIYIYDPNYPGEDDHYISVNMESNTWSYPLDDDLTWGGKDLMYLSDNLENFWLPSTPNIDTQGEQLAVYARRAPTVQGRSSTGEIFQYSADNGLTKENPSVSAIYTMNGRSAPLGYRLPRNGYSVDFTATQDSGTAVLILGEKLMFTYESDAQRNETDRISWSDRSITVYNPGDRSRTIYADALFQLEEGSRTLGVSDLVLAAGDSIRFEIGEEELIVENYGKPTRYTLVVRQVTRQGKSAGDYPIVDLPTNEEHRITPPWWNLGTRLPIYVADGNGTAKDTIYRINTLLGVDENPSGTLNGLTLPNPLPDLTTLEVNLKGSGHLQIDAFNSLGRKVATLFEGEQASGSAQIPIDARELTAGYYILHVSLNGKSIGSLSVLRAN